MHGIEAKSINICTSKKFVLKQLIIRKPNANLDTTKSKDDVDVMEQVQVITGLTSVAKVIESSGTVHKLLLWERDSLPKCLRVGYLKSSSGAECPARSIAVLIFNWADYANGRI